MVQQMTTKTFEPAPLTEEQQGKCFLLGIGVRIARPANNYYAHQVQPDGYSLYLRGNGYANTNPLRFDTPDEAIIAVTNMKALGVHWGE